MESPISFSCFLRLASCTRLCSRRTVASLHVSMTLLADERRPNSSANASPARWRARMDVLSWSTCSASSTLAWSRKVERAEVRAALCWRALCWLAIASEATEERVVRIDSFTAAEVSSTRVDGWSVRRGFGTDGGEGRVGGGRADVDAGTDRGTKGDADVDNPTDDGGRATGRNAS